MTPYELFADTWKDCTNCNLCHTRKQVVLAKGTIPCHILLIGEAPGFSEDSIGVPFSGPSGFLLDSILDQAGATTDIDVAFTNMTCCLPLDDEGTKVDEPDDESVHACSDRLKEFVALADPKLIVAVGSFAWGWLDPTYRDRIKFHREIPVIDIRHPAAILRAPEVSKSLEIRRCVNTIREAIRDFI